MKPDIKCSKSCLILSLQSISTPVSTLALLAPRKPSSTRTYKLQLCEALLRSLWCIQKQFQIRNFPLASSSPPELSTLLFKFCWKKI